MKEMLWDETGSDTRTQPPWNMHNNEFEGMVTSQCLPRHGQSKYSCDVQWDLTWTSLEISSSELPSFSTRTCG
ncbi:hypothetical protein Pcinc_017965 [Petrolisthes cinctipes]|uniref:Uncharacterized protein n=1 Tax=Petrolisthes cinctipes TaxID=88211 RepID=A0AAE1KJV8_PETCI|nr:hypothetical protein Pcinc_017965 [Petrolisthes cinctipes]